MAKRIYTESVKKWAIRSGISGGTLIGLIFMYLIAVGSISNVSYSPDSICAGTELDPCYAYINFTANEDIFIYPTDYDPWGRDPLFNFDPKVKSWKLERSWGNYWWEYDLTKPCTSPRCGAKQTGDPTYSLAWRKGKTYQIRITGYKNSPYDTIKWGAFSGFDEIDPVWEGISGGKILIDYKNNNMTIEFKEGADVLGVATLKSHQTYDEIKKVATGKNKTVIWYEFLGFKDVQIGALKGVEFIDVREFIVNDSKEHDVFEEPGIIKNPNYLLPIEKEYYFVYLSENGKWLSHNSFDIPKENIIIGVQTDLFWGEFLDVKFDILGNKLDRHAVVLGVSSGFVTTAPTADPTAISSTMDSRSGVTKDTSPASAVKIVEIGFYVGTNADESPNFELALYDSDGVVVPGEAGTRLFVEATNTLSDGIGWKSVTVDWEVSSSHDYWFGLQIDDTTTDTGIDRTPSGGSGFDWNQSNTVTTLPDPYDGGVITDSDGMFAIYAVWVDAGPPTVTLNAPLDNTDYTSAQAVNFNCTVYDDFNVTNVTFYWNLSGNFIANGTNTSGINNSDYIFNRNVDEFGDFVWNCKGVDNDSNEAFATNNFSFSFHTNQIIISDPTTASPDSVSSGDNITIAFNYSADGVNQTTGVTMENVTIGGSYTEIIGADFPPGQIQFHSFENNFTDPWFDDGISEAWTRDTDGTTSSGTGPQPQGSASGSHGDWYIYVETSSAECNTNGETAITYQMPPINWDNQVGETINWSNYAYGGDIGNLTLQENSTGSWQILWEEVGTNIQAWRYNTTDLSSLTGTGNLRFYYICAGGFAGDLALDEINISFTGSQAQQFSFVNGNWNVNVTVPTFASGLKDLFVNATHSSTTRNSTQTNAVNYGVTDSCTYTSGNWAVDCSDHCNITNPVDVGGNDISIIGDGQFTTDSDITDFGEVFISGGAGFCDVRCLGGCFLD